MVGFVLKSSRWLLMATKRIWSFEMIDTVSRKRLIWNIQEWFNLPIEVYAEGHYGRFLTVLRSLEPDAVRHIMYTIRDRVVGGPDPDNRIIYINNWLKDKARI